MGPDQEIRQEGCPGDHDDRLQRVHGLSGCGEPRMGTINEEHDLSNVS